MSMIIYLISFKQQFQNSLSLSRTMYYCVIWCLSHSWLQSGWYRAYQRWIHLLITGDSNIDCVSNNRWYESANCDNRSQIVQKLCWQNYIRIEFLLHYMSCSLAQKSQIENFASLYVQSNINSPNRSYKYQPQTFACRACLPTLLSTVEPWPNVAVPGFGTHQHTLNPLLTLRKQISSVKC